MPMDLRLSEEQQHAVDLSAAADTTGIVARAGTGKTHTLRAIAHRTASERSLFVAFNRAIAQEARQKFPTNVDVKTLHALAFGHLRREHPNLPERVQVRIPHDAWVALAGLDEDDPDLAVHITALRRLYTRFTQSADPQPDASHLHVEEGDPLFRDLGADPQERCAWYALKVQQAWQHLTADDTPYPIDHDGYLKWFALTSPRLAYDRLLVDEAQDLAPVMRDLVAQQSAATTFVGDPAQQIYAWRGAVNAMRSLRGRSATLTASFRFGPAIAAASKRILNVLEPTAELTGRGESGHVMFNPAPTDQARTIVCRSNAGVLEAALAHAAASLHIVGGLSEAVQEAQYVAALRNNRPQPVRWKGPIPQRLAGLRTWSALEEAADRNGGSLKRLKRLADRYGAQLPSALRAITSSASDSESEASVVITTAHKAKGREWDHVEAWDDFPDPPTDHKALLKRPNIERDVAELNLLYVTLTRAQRTLYVGRLSGALQSLLGAN
mgnify:CR=1 FL=1